MPYERWEIRDVLKTNVCPRRLVTKESQEWLRLYHFYREGHLLYSGGLADQPFLYLFTMHLISNLIAEAREHD